MKKDPVSWAAIRAQIAPIIAGGVGAVLSKLAMAEAAPHQGPYAYALFQCLIMCIIYFLVLKHRNNHQIFSVQAQPALRAGVLIAIVWPPAIVFKNYAFGLAPNPGYAAVLLMLDSVWVACVCKFLGKADESDKISGFGLVASAALLVLINSYYFQ